MKDRSDTAMLILSCDKYADIWDPFFRFFRKFWPECPYHVYLGTNELSFEAADVATIRSGAAADWTTDTRNILTQLKEKYVIVLLEDYFLYAPVDQKRLDECIELMEKERAVFMRIGCFPADHFPDYAYDRMEGNDWCGRTRKDALYGVNLQAGIWNREEFIALLHGKENPWRFEIEATKRWAASGKTALGLIPDPRLSYVHGPITYLCTALSRGVWMKDAIELGEKEGIKITTGNRQVESNWQYRKRRLYHSLPFWTRRYVDYIRSKTKRRSESV